MTSICVHKKPSISNDQLDKAHQNGFAKLFKKHVRRQEGLDGRIYELAHGPSRYVKNFNGSFINGFKFHTKQFGEKKTSFNSGVCVIGICYNDIGNDFYGILTGIIELEYTEFLDKVVLFKCDWFDTTAGVRVHH